MIVLSFLGLALGTALMLMVRHVPFGILLVPVCVAIGPLLLSRRGLKPSRIFLIVYIAVTGILFTLIALTGSGFRDGFDPP